MLSQQIAAESVADTPSKKQQLVDRHKRLVLALQEMKDKQKSPLDTLKHAQRAQARANKLDKGSVAESTIEMNSKTVRPWWIRLCSVVRGNKNEPDTKVRAW